MCGDFWYNFYPSIQFLKLALVKITRDDRLEGNPARVEYFTLGKCIEGIHLGWLDGEINCLVQITWDDWLEGNPARVEYFSLGKCIETYIWYDRIGENKLLSSNNSGWMEGRGNPARVEYFTLGKCIETYIWDDRMGKINCLAQITWNPSVGG